MIVAFMSQKGGAGRSAAVANVAPVLSKAGYRVLVVDFDLDAPGLHRYFGLKDDDTCQEGKKGVVDLVAEYEQALAAVKRGETPSLPEIDLELCLEPKFPEVTPPREKKKLGVRLVRERILGRSKFGEPGAQLEAWVRVLPAGRLDEGYRARAAIDWNTRYESDAWRAFLAYFREKLDGLADIVLIDARAGVTAIGALCGFVLADRLILLSTPTSQALDGILDTAASLAATRPDEAKHRALFVASRINKDADSEHLGEWLADARTRVSSDALLSLWVDTRGKDSEEARRAAAAAMVDKWALPEAAVHAVGEPLVTLRNLRRGVADDPLAVAYEKLGTELRRWISDAAREDARLGQRHEERDIRLQIDIAQSEQNLAALPWLWKRLAEYELKHGGKDKAAVARAVEALHYGQGIAKAVNDAGALASLLDTERIAWSQANESARAVDAALRASAVAEAADLQHKLVYKHNLASALRGAGELIRARQIFERVAAVHRTEVPVDHDALGSTLQQLGLTLQELDGDGAALPVLAEAVSELREGNGKRETIAYTLERQAKILRKLGQLERAAEVEAEAVAERKKAKTTR